MEQRLGAEEQAGQAPERDKRWQGDEVLQAPPDGLGSLARIEHDYWQLLLSAEPAPVPELLAARAIPPVPREWVVL